MTFELDGKYLTDRIVAGDKDAENLIFLHFRERIDFLVRARVRGRVSYDDYSDILSEVKQAILFSLRNGGFDPAKGKPLEAYIAGIVSNVVALHFRNAAKQKQNVDIDSFHSLKSNIHPLTDIIMSEESEKLEKALFRLGDKYREVLLLRIYDELSIEEISIQLGIEKRRVSERINYALKLLLKELKKGKYFQYSGSFDK